MKALAVETTYDDLTQASGGAKERFRGQGGRRRLHATRVVRAAIWIAIAGGAVYFLLPQLGELQQSLRSLQAAQPAWLIAGATLVALRYVLAAVTLRQAIGQPIPFGPTLLVQVSSSFVGRLTPEGVGWLVLNQRYLERAGVGRTSALAGITLKLLAGGLARLVIMLAFTALAGTSGLVSVDLPLGWSHLLAVVLGVALVGLILRMAFRAKMSRVMAPVASGARDLATLVRQPARALALFGASAGVTLSYGLVLAAAVLAFGVDVSLLQVLAVYLGGTAVASASPTPGNLGAVEVALSAGLTAIGVASGPAVGAVMLYRLLTFWLPVVPGFIAFTYIQKKQYI